MALLKDMFPNEPSKPDEAVNDFNFDSVPAPPPALPRNPIPNRFDPRRPDTTALHPWWQRYRDSEAWHLKRALVWDMQRGKCAMCHRWTEHKNRICHHLTYDRVGFEEIDDLLAACVDCHAKIHRKVLPDD